MNMESSWNAITWPYKQLRWYIIRQRGTVSRNTVYEQKLYKSVMMIDWRQVHGQGRKRI